MRNTVRDVLESYDGQSGPFAEAASALLDELDAKTLDCPGNVASVYLRSWLKRRELETGETELDESEMNDEQT